MAGSYEHLRRSVSESSGTPLRRDYGGVDTSLIENMGDAIEAMTHMYWMIQILANGSRPLIGQVSEKAAEIEAGRATFRPVD